MMKVSNEKFGNAEVMFLISSEKSGKKGPLLLDDPWPDAITEHSSNARLANGKPST